MANVKQQKNNPSNPKDMQKAWAELQKELKENNSEFREAVREIFKGRTGMLEDIRKAISDGSKKQSEFSKWMFGDDNKYETELEKLEQYLSDRKEIEEKIYPGEENKEKRKAALFLLDEGYKAELSKLRDDDGFVGDLVKDMSGTLASGLSDMLTDYEHFGANFKKLGKSLADQMVKTSADALIKIIINEQTTAAMIQAIRATLGVVGGGLGAVGGFLGGIFKFHSGGTVPSSGGYSLPGTAEHIALLKGGERVLSPGENAQYEGGSGINNVNVINFHVKAWDARDVSRYLMENKSLIQSITAQGIKDNNQSLRTIVQNV
jgi:hypothetical protein